MAECPITLTSIDGRCETAAGGIKRILVAPKSAIKIAVSAVKAANKITTADLDKETGVVGTPKFEEFYFRPGTCSMTSTSTIDTAIGSSSITTVLSMQFTRMEQAKRVAVQQLINTGAVAIVQDYVGTYYFLGFDMPTYTTSATAQTGQAIGDLNGYTLEMTDTSFELPYIVDDTEENINKLKVSVPVA